MSRDARIYELFANIFAREPTSEFLRLFQLEENKKLFDYSVAGLFSDIRHLPPDKQKDLLAIEYARLFLAPNALASPYESIQLGENRLWGESAVSVNSVYKEYGFELDRDFKDLPDHLSVELAFLANLATIEFEYRNKGMDKASIGVLAVKKHFLENHLLKWFFRFKEGVIRYAKLSFYKEMVHFLEMFLDKERKDLNGQGKNSYC